MNALESVGLGLVIALALVVLLLWGYVGTLILLSLWGLM